MIRKESTPPILTTRRSPATLILIAAVVAIPLVLSPPAQDAFRFPKELLMRLAAILLLISGAIAFSRRDDPFGPIARSRSMVALTAIIVAWAAITSLASTNRPLSLVAMLWVTTCAVFFLASHFTTERRTLTSIEWIAIPTLINIAVYAMQELDLWRPFGIIKQTADRGSVALLGNPDDVGMFLVPAAIAGVALWRSSEKRRALHLAVAIAAAVTILWTQTLTAVAALLVGAGVAALLTWPRPMRRTIAVAIIAAIAMSFLLAPLRNRIVGTISAARAGDYDRMLAGRALAWAAAWEMVKAHPVTGVGPGCYAWQYFPFRREAELKRAGLLVARLRHSNFAQAHNDQLQLAATSGIPAYALFLLALWRLAAFSRRTGPTAEARFSQLLGAPLAACMFVLTAAQFPLELAAPMAITLYLAGSISGWSAQS